MLINVRCNYNPYFNINPYKTALQNKKNCYIIYTSYCLTFVTGGRGGFNMKIFNFIRYFHKGKKKHVSLLFCLKIFTTNMESEYLLKYIIQTSLLRTNTWTLTEYHFFCEEKIVHWVLLGCK